MGGEQAGLSLIYAVTVDVAKRWRGIRMTPGDLEKLNELRAEVAVPRELFAAILEDSNLRQGACDERSLVAIEVSVEPR